MISDAVSSARVSAVVGYELKGGNFATVTPNLPQRVGIFGEANTANQSSVTAATEGVEILNSVEAGQKFGFGSPIHMAARILIPVNGGGVNGIPVVVYPVAEATGATNKELELVVTGTASGPGTHQLVIAGRDNIDGIGYTFNIPLTGSVSEIHSAIADSVNAVLSCPFVAVASPTEVTFTSKFKGVTADDLTIEVNTGNDSLDLTYTITENSAGSGLPSGTELNTGINLVGDKWTTLMVNCWDFSQNAVLDVLEAFNGKPLDSNPTGRYSATNWKPFVAFGGYIGADGTALTDVRKDEVTNSLAHMPNSLGLPLEAAANVCVLQATRSENEPHKDTLKMVYPDAPSYLSAPIENDYDQRDAFVKKGHSTVEYSDGKYIVMDLVTTYHPTGELTPQYRFVRNLAGIDMNVRYGYLLLEEAYLVGKTILADGDLVGDSLQNWIKPKVWKGLVNSYADDLQLRALIADTTFMKESINVGLSATNPDRFDTFFRYKRPGTVRISSSTAEAGFNYGTL